MISKITVKDIESGNIPAFVKTEEFRKIFPIGRNRLLEICSLKGAPIIHNGRTIIIKTQDMIEFISNKGAIT